MFFFVCEGFWGTAFTFRRICNPPRLSIRVFAPIKRFLFVCRNGKTNWRLTQRNMSFPDWKSLYLAWADFKSARTVRCERRGGAFRCIRFVVYFAAHSFRRICNPSRLSIRVCAPIKRFLCVYRNGKMSWRLIQRKKSFSDWKSLYLVWADFKSARTRPMISFDRS